MAVRIRLKRVGGRSRPTFRVVVTDLRNPRDGRFLEALGSYEPLYPGQPNFSLDLERAKYWLSVGARPSDTVASLIRRAEKGEGRPKGAAIVESRRPAAVPAAAEAAVAGAAPDAAAPVED